MADLPLKGDTVIGNDVWIGQNATILPGVRIGDGAIIGANSIVGSDVSPYTIVVGNPANVLRKRFDDEMIELLQQGKMNIPLFCELATHKDFPKLLADIEIYVNRFASKMIGFLNSFVDAGREQILTKAKPLQPDNILNLLTNISIDEGNYFDRRIHDDMDAIIKDMREMHKDRSESASDDPAYDPIGLMSETLDELAQFKGKPI